MVAGPGGGGGNGERGLVLVGFDGLIHQVPVPGEGFRDVAGAGLFLALTADAV